MKENTPEFTEMVRRLTKEPNLSGRDLVPEDPELAAKLDQAAEEARGYKENLGNQALALKDWRKIKDLGVHTNYSKLTEIASGGLGIVYKAEEVLSGRLVAIKFLKSKYANSPEHIARFENEAAVTAGLNHPNIIPVYAMSAEMEEFPYYVMRYVPGEKFSEKIEKFHQNRKKHVGLDLSKIGIVEQDNLELQELLAHFVDICEAVAHAHDRMVLHLDLKENNIMVGEFGETVLVDWGLAAPLEDEGENGGVQVERLSDSSRRPLHFVRDDSERGVQGTLDYMSPELVEENGRVGREADVFSLGVILYNILTGRSRSQEAKKALETDDDKISFIRSGYQPSLESGVLGSMALQKIMQKAMAKKHSDRYSSAGELAEDVKRVLAGEPVDVCPEGVVEKFQRAMRSYRGLKRVMRAFAGLLCVAVIAIIYYEHSFGLEKEKTANSVTEAYSMAMDVMVGQLESSLLDAVEGYFSLVDIIREDSEFKEHFPDVANASEKNLEATPFEPNSEWSWEKILSDNADFASEWERLNSRIEYLSVANNFFMGEEALRRPDLVSTGGNINSVVAFNKSGHCLVIVNPDENRSVLGQSFRHRAYFSDSVRDLDPDCEMKEIASVGIIKGPRIAPVITSSNDNRLKLLFTAPVRTGGARIDGVIGVSAALNVDFLKVLTREFGGVGQTAVRSLLLEILKMDEDWKVTCLYDSEGKEGIGKEVTGIDSKELKQILGTERDLDKIQSTLKTTGFIGREVQFPITSEFKNGERVWALLLHYPIDF